MIVMCRSFENVFVELYVTVIHYANIGIGRCSHAVQVQPCSVNCDSHSRGFHNDICRKDSSLSEDEACVAPA